MKIVIFAFGLVFLAVGQANPIDLINEINAVQSQADGVLIEAEGVLNEAVATRAQIKVLVQRNGLVAQATAAVSQNPEREDCRVVLKKSIRLVVGLVNLEVKKLLPAGLVRIEIELKDIKNELEVLKGKVAAGSPELLGIAKRVKRLARGVNKLRAIIPTLTSPDLAEIESKIIPALAGVNILGPVTVCLKL